MELNNQLNKHLRNLLTEAIENENINFELDFAELGIDSMSVFTITSQLQEIIPEIPLTIFLECKNINELQEYLLKNYSNEIEQHFNS